MDYKVKITVSNDKGTSITRLFILSKDQFYTAGKKLGNIASSIDELEENETNL